MEKADEVLMSEDKGDGRGTDSGSGQHLRLRAGRATVLTIVLTISDHTLPIVIKASRRWACPEGPLEEGVRYPVPSC